MHKKTSTNTCPPLKEVPHCSGIDRVVKENKVEPVRRLCVGLRSAGLMGYCVQIRRKGCSDNETKSEVFGSEWRIHHTQLRCRAYEKMSDTCPSQPVKHGGGSIMFWAVLLRDLQTYRSPTIPIMYKAHEKLRKWRVQEHCPTSTADTWEVQQKAWEEIPAEKLISRMPLICQAVIAASFAELKEAKLFTDTVLKLMVIYNMLFPLCRLIRISVVR